MRTRIIIALSLALLLAVSIYFLPSLISPPPAPTVVNLVNKERSSNEVYHPMKITFRQSGGYGGLRLGYEVDTASLSPDEATKLESLVQQSGILQTSNPANSNPAARDLLQYQITVENQGTTRQISFDDSSLPPGIEPLLDYLQDRAKAI